MSVVIFEPDYNAKHCKVLRALADGIPGAKVKTLGNYTKCDIAVIFGWHKYAYDKTRPKAEIISRHKGRSLIVVESGFLKRGEYYQVGWGGFANNADFCNQNVSSDRWDAMGVTVKDWQKRDGPVVVCGQLERDTQVQDTDHHQWCRDTFKALIKMGEEVIFCPHPREDRPSVYGIDKQYRAKERLPELLKIAKCVVTYNSTSCVDAILAGVPAITMDKGSIAWPISQHALIDVKQLAYPDRSQWLAGLGYTQWTLDEMRAGLPWRHLNA